MDHPFRPVVALVFVLILVTAADAKTRRTFYTDATLQTAQANLKAHDWARRQRDAIVGRADRLLAYGADELRFRLVPPPSVARAYVVHNSGCPVHGEAAHKTGRYSWVVSPDHPWQVRCPAGGETYPSNDFAAYLRGGMTDKSLLASGEFVDDGRGYKKPAVDKKFWFVGFYAHWAARDHLLPALRDLSQAYLLTGDARYAHACAALLWQLAEYYPDYNYETQSRMGTEFQPDYKGRLLYHTWEAAFTAQTVPPAYDAVFPAIAGDAALRQRTGLTADQIRTRIEDRLLRTMARDVMDGSHRIQGNWGMHQVALLRIAAVLDEAGVPPTSRAMVDWVLHNDRATLYTDLGLYDALANLLHRDGYPFESPGYSVHWITEVLRIAEALAPAGVDVSRHPRFAPLLRWPLETLAAGRFSPALGDSGNMFAPAIGLDADLLAAGFKYTGDPRFARALVQAGLQPPQDLFEPYAADALPAAATKHPEPVGTRSAILPDAGIASLQTGTAANRTAVSVFYGYYVGHAHFDRLHTDLFAHGWALTPDFGYPETADRFDPRRAGFFSNTVTHNTVVIDAKRQAADWGELHAYDPGDFAQTIEVSAERAYPGKAKLYRRTLILVDATPDKAYLVDVFRVRGSRRHDYLVHGTQADVASTLPLSDPRPGTLAGPDVPYGSFYDDPNLRDKPAGSVSYSGYAGSGYQFLSNVREAPLDGTATVDWRLNRPEAAFPKQRSKGIVLRAHLVGTGETVCLADGKPQFRENWPETVPFLVRRRTGAADDDLESVYVTVYEPYDGSPFIESVRPVPVTGAAAALPVALEVTMAGGDRHVVFTRLETGAGPSTVAAPGGPLVTDARAAVIALDRGGTVTQTYSLDAGQLSWPGQDLPQSSPAVQAVVRSVDHAAGTIILEEPVLTGQAATPAGNLAIIRSPGHATAVPVAKVLDGRTFSVGEHDLAAARLRVRASAGDRLTVSPPFAYFVRPGMTAVDEAGTVIGRVRSMDGATLVLDRPAPHVDTLSDADRDGRREIRIAAVGPGHTVTLHVAMRR